MRTFLNLLVFIQFQAAYWSNAYAQDINLIYVAAHDPEGNAKTINYWAGDAGSGNIRVTWRRTTNSYSAMNKSL